MTDAEQTANLVVHPFAEDPAHPGHCRCGTPLGLMPLYVWKAKVREQRIIAILDAMDRYTVAQRPAKSEWVAELRSLIFEDGQK
jgi:hypothetical protein